MCQNHDTRFFMFIASLYFLYFLNVVLSYFLTCLNVANHRYQSDTRHWQNLLVTEE